ncbi:hypothetical protein K8R04_04410 [Candidatus Uhrbacteria bacterium]|nr:hypothetical protein [Candidatus Uhrbacteria bacterium]
MLIIAYCMIALGACLAVFGLITLRKYLAPTSEKRERLIRRGPWTYILGTVSFVSGLLTGLAGLLLLYIYR